MCFFSQIMQIFSYWIWQAMQTYCYDEDPVLGACGISIEKQLTCIDGRVLEAPKVNLIFSLLMCKRGV